MNQNNCPTCHAPIAENAPGGFCPACLLREASDEGSLGERSTPSLSELAEAFPNLEMLELIGQGGIASENGDYQSLYASQAFPLIKHRTAVEVFEELKKGV